MSLEEYDTAKEILDSFARMMRYSLANIKSYVTVRQELDYIESYLAIQKIRFGSGNAIEHGILGRPCGGKLILQCLSLEEYVYIRIKDQG